MTTFNGVQVSPTDASELEERNSSASGSDAENDDPGTVETLDDNGNPSKKRKRSLKISCELCKTRKVKCDRVEPACGWCARNNRICVYKERQKPGLRVGYGRELEEKINRLEALLQVMGRRLEEHIVDHNDGSQHRPTPLRMTSQPMQYSTSYSQNDPRPSSASMASQDTPTADPRWVPSNAYERMQYPPRAQDAMSIRSVVDTSGQDLTSHSDRAASTAWYPTSTPAALIPESELPPYDLLYTLVDLYFKHINPWSPILDRKATLDAFFGSQSMDEADRVLMHAVVATTLRFSKDPRLTPESRSQFHDISRQKITLYALDNPNVRALQALVILAVDILGTSNGQQGWNLLALIARNVVQLGLEVEKGAFLESSTAYPSATLLEASQPKSWIESEERRRLCWMTFVLDRYATVATADAFILDEREMDRCLPCRYDLFSRNEPVETRWRRRTALQTEMLVNKPENLGSFSYHCEVLGILSRIHRFLHQPLDITRHSDIQRWRETYRELDGELNNWLQNLPGEYGKISQLCHSDPGSRISNWIMLHAAFVTSVIRLHSSAAYPTIKSSVFTPSYHAIQRCLGAVESLREIAQDVLNTGMLSLLGHPFAFALWVSARALLVHAATMECEIDPKITFFISTLEQMGQHWQVAREYARILNNVVQEGSTGSGRTFTAMRRTAYELNILISKRPRSVLDPVTTHTAPQNELEYLEIFDFFNYPRLNAIAGNGYDPAVVVSPAGNAATQQQQPFRATPAFAIPNPESDWLIFKPPYE
ncbi:hypothetical protein LTR10_015094 [Elasticomyces elasticus]|uniref:Zn(2)-C6 fungal-type domain-containing protein n=1 Tax=Exophiala sideris TaxID=1016849 RepID=A0ABR0JR21_9EURO|nr:hypothetical protein LTR10_015094 [Elasticomyces elasticus]KAK5034708.1 hypothetical protein LTR13_006364 [Exophiala sideris]KAK5039969.1 hypothetical protein LTS07_000464 [Exophiala sideris]KAK5068348.1 hypothetical protein LTR69_000466 [Exophiala sideris]KAK5187649.1 hypothetical protein LTR44_000465 [Eurotiomycetes sp. CCFEE 6388]